MTAGWATDASGSAAWGRSVDGAQPRRPMAGGVVGGAARAPAAEAGSQREAGRPAAAAAAVAASGHSSLSSGRGRTGKGEGLAVALGHGRPGGGGAGRLRGEARGRGAVPAAEL